MNISRILLTIVNVLICVFVLCITAYLMFLGALGAGWGGRDVTWLDLLYNTKGFAFVGILALVAIIGQAEKRKFGFISGLAVAMSISLYGILATCLEMGKGHAMNSMDLTALIICFLLGIGLFFWTNYHFKLKHKSTRKDWIFVVMTAGTCTTQLVLDRYFL